MVGEVIDEHDRLDILVNNAGITADKPFMKMTADDWDKVIRVNLSGAFYMSKPALEHMIERGSGRIVNISSIVGQMGNIGQANYAASKSGMFGLTTTLAREAAQALAKADKLHENGPGPYRQLRGAGLHRDRHDRRPAREGGRERQEADPARAGWAAPRRSRAWCTSCAPTRPRYITGQVFAVNGGMDM